MLADGQILDDTYRLIRQVGEGAMGVVYEATHARLAGRYAIKVLTQRLEESPEGFPRFDREARITSLLQHPNIVQVIDHNTAPDGTEYLVMEYLAGETLSQRLVREGRLPLDTVVDIVEQIAAGLSAAHTRGIVHRDLKPDNVVLVPVEGRQTELVKILDFGISKRRGSLEVSGLVCGTPQYMAPEQVEGRVLDIDAATDQFALAVIAHEMLTGCNPFKGDSVAAVFSRISAESPMPVGFGKDVDEALARALAKSSRRRFPIVTEFAEAFRAGAKVWQQANQALAVVPTGGKAGDVERTLRSRRRSWRWVLGATATVSAIFLVAERRPDRLLAAGRARAVMVAAKFRPDSGQRAQTPPGPAENQAVLPAAPSVVQEIVDPQVTALIQGGSPPREAAGRGSSVARTRQPARIRPGSRPTASRSRVALPVDEDATMPPSEITAEDLQR